MSEYELRALALKHATHTCGESSAEHVLAVAQKYFDFLMGKSGK